MSINILCGFHCSGYPGSCVHVCEQRAQEDVFGRDRGVREHDGGHGIRDHQLSSGRPDELGSIQRVPVFFCPIDFTSHYFTKKFFTLSSKVFHFKLCLVGLIVKNSYPSRSDME